jgi:hypothetical protein
LAIAKIKNDKLLDENEVTHVIKAVGSMEMQWLFYRNMRMKWQET